MKILKSFASNSFPNTTSKLNGNLDLHNLLFKYKISADKRLGQNFLVNNNVVRKLIDYAKIDNKIVLEIGSGTGTITKELLTKAKKVYAIEIDKKLCDIINKEFSDFIKTGQLQIINDDIIQFDLAKLVKDKNIDVIVSAPPYYISTPLIYKIINLPIKKAVLLMQKDFLDKITNDVFYSPSALSVITYYFTKPEFLDIISATNFEPKPKVESQLCVLKYKQKRTFDKHGEQKFIEIIKEIFRYPNKSLRKALILSINRFDKKTQKVIADIIDNCNKGDMKITEISSSDYVKIFKDL